MNRKNSALSEFAPLVSRTGTDRVCAQHPTVAESNDPDSHEPRRRPTILVFCAELLPASQSFVRDHVESIRDFDVVLVGARRTNGLALDKVDALVLPESRTARGLLWLFGRSGFLDRLVRERNVVAIHAHFADAGMKIATYAKLRNLPLVVTLHGADVLRRRSESFVGGILKASLRRRMFRSAALFLPVSEFIRTAASRQGYPVDRLRLHFLGIPLAPERSRRNDPKAGSTPRLLFIGRLVEKKGLTYLLEACRILKREGCRFRLTVIGDGPLASRHRAEAEDLSDRVEFLGVLPPETVRREMETADIVCMPSTEAGDGDNEGLPIVCLEAQAAGVPLVAFDQGPVREGVISGKTALLARDRSADGLAAAVRRLLEDPDLRVTMGASGRAFVSEKFDISQRSRELEGIYRTLAEQGHSFRA